MEGLPSAGIRRTREKGRRRRATVPGSLWSMDPLYPRGGMMSRKMQEGGRKMNFDSDGDMAYDNTCGVAVGPFTVVLLPLLP